eukprot:Clim_evm71s207 gene=Clim_evmTU71s207
MPVHKLPFGLSEDQICKEVGQYYGTDAYRKRLPKMLTSLWHQLEIDQEIVAFVQDSEQASNNWFLQIYHNVGARLLRSMFTQTTSNGLLFRGQMKVLSESQYENICQASGVQMGQRDLLLDIGAGDGSASLPIARKHRQSYCTEMSQIMVWRLIYEQGYQAHLTPSFWTVPELQDKMYDTILMWNLLDRCSNPKQQLAEASKRMHSNSTLLIALVLPYKPYVECKGGASCDCDLLDLPGLSAVEDASRFIAYMATIGLSTIKMATAPYMCRGDTTTPVYILPDYVFVCRLSHHT